ncbi:hypothetical protein QA612_14315 [Evansella sp. AB-P1]|uniref:hypothetical protein n=1 Tax=Evansella sp. AB-P1 TaxID=3037653 RepID=UPI00241FA3B6|nr:hypothetical protein [Evansella sp. AB-P1]MDG5788652.1 hypothetical protein [Evansella sp. AB-P1]
MPEIIRSETTHTIVLYLIVEVVDQYAKNEWPSPTIKELSTKIGYSEEMILESLEYGQIEPISILQ